MDRMTHQENIQSHSAAQLAAGVPAGTASVLEGGQGLAPRRCDDDLDDCDAGFSAFAKIWSEIGALAIGDACTFGSTETLARLAPEIYSVSEWAAPQALPACRAIVVRCAAQPVTQADAL